MNWIAQGRTNAARSPAGEDSFVRERKTALTAETLQREYLGAVFRYVARHIRQREEAEDVTATVFAAAFESLGRFRGQCSPQAWLFGIARRKVADSLRRSARRREISPSNADNPGSSVESLVQPGAEAERSEEITMLRGIVRRLAADQRDALLMQYVDGLSVAEIAAVMGRSPAAVNSLLQRARAAVYKA